MFINISFVGCELPKDSRDSVLDAQINGLKIGVVVNPPFTVHDNTGFSGSEIELLQEFCSEKSITYQLIEGTESELIKKLNKADIHIIIGGFKKNTIWQEKVGLTKTYDEEHVLLVPKGENKLVMELESFMEKNKAR
ncbi:transporter substrate-binding domain-containing protein [Galbibacter sp. PAP.153]|uniref:transporter substrate-binding domain-containing protein n=1 Tax=Galbibacter sp. PAP.153 TaxID=3104623 RepID=UPI00300AEC5E